MTTQKTIKAFSVVAVIVVCSGMLVSNQARDISALAADFDPIISSSPLYSFSLEGIDSTERLNLYYVNFLCPVDVTSSSGSPVYYGNPDGCPKTTGQKRTVIFTCTDPENGSWTGINGWQSAEATPSSSGLHSVSISGSDSKKVFTITAFEGKWPAQQTVTCTVTYKIDGAEDEQSETVVITAHPQDRFDFPNNPDLTRGGGGCGPLGSRCRALQ